MDFDSAEIDRIIDSFGIDWKDNPRGFLVRAYTAGVAAGREAMREDIIPMLDGIDQCETQSDNGWWETPTGADRGASILAAIRALPGKEG